MPKIVVQKTSITLVVVKFLLIIATRFFLGWPMKATAKKADNASFLKGATRGRPGKVLSRWQKRPYLHRALIRGSVFWPFLGIIVLLITDKRIALFLLVCSSIPLAVLMARKGQRIFFDPFTSTDAVSGARTQHWRLKVKWRRLGRPLPLPGYVPRSRRKGTGDFPPDVERLLREAINASEEGGMPASKVARR